MAKLKKEHKVQIIRMLAKYSAPTDVQKFMKKEHGLSVQYNQIYYYNPERPEGHRLSKEMQELFYSERSRFLDSTEGLTYTHRAYRLRRLCELAEEYRKEKDRRNEIKLIITIDELMTREQGDNKKAQNEDDIPPTLQQINNYLYFDK